jgi:hypothetical protein
MIRTITITPSVTEAYIKRYGDGFRLRVEVTAATNVDPNIFLYLLKPLAPGQDTPEATFQKVCSPRDMAAYPATSPPDDANPPWFRLDHVQLDFDNRAEVQATIDEIRVMIKELLDAMATNDVLAAIDPITISSGS